MFERVLINNPLLAKLFSNSQKAIKNAPFIVDIINRQIFKIETHEQPKPTKYRQRFSFLGNSSAALALNCATNQLVKIQDDHNALLHIAQNNILEHANRRIDLFFYLLTAYYRTMLIPIISRTTLQYGKGRHSPENQCLTAACHSSFLPALHDNFSEKDSLLSETHFLDNLNSTVELPVFVNRFDHLLENKFRPICLNILRKVSLGEINPIEGLAFLLKRLHKELHQFKQEAEHRDDANILPLSLMKQPHLNPKLIELVIQGTLATTFSPETQTVTSDYIDLLLRLTPKEKQQCQNNPKVKEQLYLEKLSEIKREIMETKSSKIIPPRNSNLVKN